MPTYPVKLDEYFFVAVGLLSLTNRNNWAILLIQYLFYITDRQSVGLGTRKWNCLSFFIAGLLFKYLLKQ